MKSRLLVALVAAVSSSATVPPLQAADCSSCEAEAGVFITGDFYASWTGSWIDVSVANGGAINPYIPQDGTYDLEAGTATLKPGKDYVVSVSGEDIYGYRLHFNPGNGYAVYINGLRRNLWDASDTNFVGFGGDDFTLRVEIDPGNEFTPAGEALPLSNNKVVWRVGLGQLRNGKSAGYMAIRQLDLDSATFQISSLIYEPPSPEVDRVPNTGTITQVRAPFGLAEVSSISGGYKIEFYYHVLVTGPDGNGNYAHTGSPFVSYEITSQASDTILRIERIRGSSRWRTELQKVSSTEWRMTDWHRVVDGDPETPLRYDVRYLSSGNLVEDLNIQDALSSPNIATRTQNTYANKGWGTKELTQSKANFNGSTGETTTYTYHEYYTSYGDYGKLASIAYPDGDWVAYEYCYDLVRRGQIYRVFHPWESSPSSPGFTASSGLVTTYTYNYEDWNHEYRHPTLIETRINNTLAGKTSISYSRTTINGEPVLTASRDEFHGSGSTDKITTVIKTYDRDASDSYYRDQPYSITRPDGTVDAFVYHNGYYDAVTKSFIVSGSSGARRRLIFRGATSSDGISGATQYTSYSGATMESVYMIPHQSVLEEWVTGIDGRPLFQRKYLFIGNGTFEDMGGKLLITCTEQGVPKHVYDYNRASNFVAYNSTWVDGQKTAETDVNGVSKTFTYDTLGRVSGVTVSAKGNVPAMTTTFNYDAANRMTKESRGTSDPVDREWLFDDAGRVQTMKYRGESTQKQVGYAYPNAGRDLEIDYADGSERNTVRHSDGHVISVTGTAGPPEYFKYTVNSDGSIETRRQLSSATGDSDGWVKTTVDWLGRIKEVARPTFENGGTQKVIHTYDTSTPSTGQLVQRNTKVGSTDIAAPEYFTYNVMGWLERAAADVDGSGIANSSKDRIQEFEYDSFTDGGYRFLRQKTFIYPNNASSSRITAAETSRRINGLTSTLAAESRAVDITGATTTVQSVVDQANAKVEIQTIVSGVSNTAKSITQNGLLIQTISASGVTTDFAYDAYGRLVTVDGYSDKKTEYIYHAQSDLRYQARTYYGPGAGDYFVQGTWNYDDANRVRRFLDSHGDFVRYKYDPTTSGLRVYQWGTKGHPLKRLFNTYGWLDELHTYRSGTGWADDYDTLPSGFSSAGDKTEWNYDNWTGLTTGKVDHAGKTVSFDYNSRFQISKKTHARKTTGGADVYVDYDYYDATSNLTGELETVNYSDAITQDLTFTYERTGRLESVIDKLGTRTFGYNTALQLNHEVFPSGFLGDLEINHGYETSGLHSRETLELGSSGDYDRDHKDAFAYNGTTGRLSSVTRHHSGGTTAFTYGYFSGNDLVESITSGSYVRTTYWQYFRDIEDEVKTTWNGTNMADYLYQGVTATSPNPTIGTDLEGRRNAEKLTGEVAVKLGYSYGFLSTWTYTDRGEVDQTEARAYGASNTLNGDGVPIPSGGEITAWRRDWNWDDFSNRTAEDRDGAVGSPFNTTYTPNTLNQYASITGDLAESTLTYDDDGNLKQDGTWDYRSNGNDVTYDGENRPVKMSNGSVTLTFDYDYLGRRVRKTVSSGLTAGTYEYVYDGWNLLAVYKNESLESSFTWGLDKSGTLGGAGGTGGLLLQRTGTANLYPTYDARGNVTGLITATGGLARAYHFDAFGNRIGSWKQTGLTDIDYIGFASKYTDIETGLVYFGFRYYQPKHGRFINRDPIGEAGGEHLYAHTWNDAVNGIDVLGLCPPGTVAVSDDRCIPTSAVDDSLNSTFPTDLAMLGSHYVEQVEIALEQERQRRADANRVAPLGEDYDVPPANVGLPTLYIPPSDTPVQDAFLERGMLPPDAAVLADKAHISLETAEGLMALGRFVFGLEVTVLGVYYPPVGVALSIAVVVSPETSGLEKGLAAGGLALGGTVAIVRIAPRMVNTAAITGTANAAEVMTQLRASASGSRILVLDASRYPVSAANQAEAVANGARTILVVNRAGAAANRDAALEGLQKIPGFDLDEAPPAFLRQPGDPVIVRPTPPSDNRGAGASLGNQARPVRDGGTVIIIITNGG